MPISRRGLIGGAGALTAATAAASGRLPDRASFPFQGVYLDAAFTHPLGGFAAAAAAAYTEARRRDPQAVGPRANPRRQAVERFAGLVGVDPIDIAVVPSTLDGENLIAASLGIGPGAGVVTDALHYDASLALYGELARRGAPLAVAAPRDGSVDLADLRGRLTRDTRLIAVSLVSSATGFQHDLAELCSLAHARGVLVYADIVQAAGAVPLDLKASGVDFAACGTYKWLMGDFGAAFLYVRPDRLDRLTRVHVGWRQLRGQASHVLPFEPPGPPLGAYDLAGGAAGLFEISTPAWGALAVAAASIAHIQDLGMEAISSHRRPLIARLRDALARPDFIPLTPPDAQGPILAYAVRDAAQRFDARLAAAGVRISTYAHRIRISPSIYNDLDDVERLIDILTA